MKKKNYLILFILLLFTISLVNTKSKNSVDQVKFNKISGLPSQTKFNINRISTFIYNDGRTDIDPNGNAGFVFPNGTNKTAIYSSSLVWGGKINNQIRVGGSTYQTGLQPGRIISENVAEDPNLDHVRIYRVRRDYETANLWDDAFDMNMSIEEVFNQYEKDWNEWPAIYGAPFEDIDNNGSYDPMVDIPGVTNADQTIWFVANDLNPNLTQLLYGSPPIGIELQVTIWGYFGVNSFDEMMFRKYKLINKSSNNIDDMYISMWSDPDVGWYSDDFVGCDSLLNLAYAYNANLFDSYYNNYPPAVGYSLLQGPIVDGEESDIGFFNGTFFPGKKNLSMTAFYFNTSGDPEIVDPFSNDYTGSLQFYNQFQGRKSFTGNAFIDPTTTTPTKFPLNGEPLTNEGWIDGMIHPPADRRMGMSSGPFNMAPADTQEVVFAEMGELKIYPKAHIKNIYGVKRKAGNIKNLFINKLAVDINATPIAPLNVELELTSAILLLTSNSSVQSYEWGIENKPNGSNASIISIDVSSAKFTPDIAGDYIINLSIISDLGDTAVGRINILGSSNHAPVADFTLSKTEIIMGDTAFADGSISSDFENQPLEFQWGGSILALEPQMNKTILYPLFYIGESEVALEVSDGLFTSSKSKTVNVVPKYTEIDVNWSYLDTIYNYREGAFYGKGDTTFAVPLIYPYNIDSTKLVIYNKSNAGIEFVKEISLPDLETIATIKNDLIFVHDISNASIGFYGVGKLSIYRLSENWQLTKLLSNYYPTVERDDDIFSVHFYSDTALTRTYHKIFKIDFLTNPANPTVIDTFDFRTEYSNNGKNVKEITFNKNDIHFYGKYTDSLKYFMDVRSIMDYSLIREFSFSVVEESFIAWSSKNNKFLLARRDTVTFYELTNNYELEEGSTINYTLDLPLSPYSSSEIISLNGSKFLDDDNLVLRGTYGFEVYNVNDINNPTFVASCLDGYDNGYLTNSGSNFFIERHLFGSEGFLGYQWKGVELDLISDVENNNLVSVPTIYKLNQNYPNPFNPSTKIRFHLPERNLVRLDIFNILGQKVRTLANTEFETGIHEITFDGKNLASGVYLYRIVSGSFNETKKMLLLK
ncbi:MAG: T9SS type A sorting domain-containing protein [Ignavibacteriae bacterium]|nr:T9SS C-terminal target domain-containing protein [Ignavibacteriota bacterium]NOG99856.1 T9SS type A sorting domain-containing protein [Ignavibacteriota bacterium]